MKVEPGGETNHDIDPTPLWGDGDFYVPGLWGDGSIARVPGAADFHRRLFLTRAAMIEPALLETLHKLAIEDTFGLALWAARFSLRDRWCLSLARDEVRWHSTQPSARSYRDGRQPDGSFGRVLRCVRQGSLAVALLHHQRIRLAESQRP